MILTMECINSLQSCMDELQNLIDNTELRRKCWSLGKQTMSNPLIELQGYVNNGLLDDFDDSDYDAIVIMAKKESKLWDSKEVVSVDYGADIDGILELAYKLQRAIFAMTKLDRLQSKVNSIHETEYNWRDLIFDDDVEDDDDIEEDEDSDFDCDSDCDCYCSGECTCDDCFDCCSKFDLQE